MNERSFIIRGMKKSAELLERREAIVQAAIVCFIDKGFHGSSMRDIAQQASVSLGNLYNHFASKEALIAEVASQEQAELQPLLDGLGQAQRPSAALVREFLSAYHALCRQHEWAVLSAECLAEIARTPALAPAFEANRQRLLQALTDCLERGVAQEGLRPAAPAALVAQWMLDAVESDALRCALCPGQAEAGVQVLHPALLACLLGEGA